MRSALTAATTRKVPAANVAAAETTALRRLPKNSLSLIIASYWRPPNAFGRLAGREPRLLVRRNTSLEPHLFSTHSLRRGIRPPRRGDERQPPCRRSALYPPKAIGSSLPASLHWGWQRGVKTMKPHLPTRFSCVFL